MSSCCSCCRTKKVHPSPCDNGNNQIIEIRPNRHLLIKHLNARPRDEQFEKEYQTFLQYRKKGVSSNGPMTLPKNTRNVLTNQQSLSLITDTQPGVPLTHKQQEILSGNFTPDSVYSTTEDRKTMVSSSGIEVEVNKSPEEQTTSSNFVMSKTNKAESKVTIPTSQIDNSSVLFFIHGVGGSSDIWKSQMDYFTMLGYEIVAPDLIGHGLSCAPKDLKSYHFDQIAADIEEVFDKYCKRNNVVIGHSYGCSFAAYLARNRSKRVSKLIMISGGGPIPLAPQPSVFSLPVSMLTCLRPCVQCKYEKNAFSDAKKIAVSEAFSIPTYVLSNIMKGQIWSDGDELYHNWIVSETLLIYGREDKLISLREEERMKQAIYNCDLVVLPDAGHMVMLEQPDQVNQIIYEFLHPESQVDKSDISVPPQHKPIDRNAHRRSSIRSVKSIPDL